MNKVVFLVAGGTGGHLFPAMALSSAKIRAKIIYLVDKRTKKFFKNKNQDFIVIPSEKIHKNILKFPTTCIKIISGILISLFYILKKKPSLVVGFGGYTSVPTLIAAKLLNVKILLHEQNSVMGRTNRILSKISEKVAITFQKTKFAESKSVFTGIPLRIKNKKTFKKNNKKILLIIGGSQGANFFSELIPKVLKNFNEKTLEKIMIIQQARLEDQKKLIKLFKEMKLEFKISDFFDNIYDEISKADLIISRCGSSSLAEIEYFKKSSLLFPLPSSKDNHQLFNAIEFRKNNNCKIFEQPSLNTEKIAEELKKFLFTKRLNYKKTKKSKKISLADIINDMLR